jgi:predicted MFS family arabinose efflux permease
MRIRLSVLMFLQWAVPGALVPLYSIRLHQLGFGQLTIGVCCATQAVAAVVSSLVAGQVADRWLPAEKALAICAALAGLDLWLLAELTEPVPVLLATLFFWMSAGPMLLLGTTVSFTHLPLPEKQFGPVRMWGTLGWMVIGWVIGYWLSAPAWLAEVLAVIRPAAPSAVLPDAFRLGGVTALLMAGYALTLPHTPPRRVPGSRVLAPLGALGLLRNGAFATYAACVLGACATFAFSTQSTPLLLAQLGIPAHRISSTLTLAQSTEVVGLAVLPVLLMRLGVRGTMLLGLVAWLAAMTALAVGRPLGLAVASLGLHGIFVTGFLIAGQVYANGLAEGDLRASVQGLFQFVNGLGTLAGNLLAAWLRRWTHGELPPTFAVAAAITALMILLFLNGFHRSAERRVQSAE